MAYKRTRTKTGNGYRTTTVNLKTGKTTVSHSVVTGAGTKSRTTRTISSSGRDTYTTNMNGWADTRVLRKANPRSKPMKMNTDTTLGIGILITAVIVGVAYVAITYWEIILTILGVALISYSVYKKYQEPVDDEQRNV